MTDSTGSTIIYPEYKKNINTNTEINPNNKKRINQRILKVTYFTPSDK